MMLRLFSRICRLAIALACVRAAVAAAQDMPVYDDARRSGWEAWGWATIDYASKQPVHGGVNAIRVSATANQAVYLHHAAFDPAAYQSLSFWIYPTFSGNNRLQVAGLVNGSVKSTVNLSFTAAQVNQWQQVTVPLASLGVAGDAGFDGFWIQNLTGGTLVFHLDDVALNAPPPPDPVSVTVTPSEVLRTIDERLFGMNLAVWDGLLGGSPTEGLLESMDTRALRIPGGSLSDDYNWHTNRSVSSGTFQWANSAARFAKVAETRGAQAYVVVNYGSGTPEQAAAWVAYYNGRASDTRVIGVDAKGRDWKTAGHWAAIRGAAPLATDDGFNFLRMAHPAPFGFRYWEIGNECYGSWEYDQHGTAGSGLTGQPHDAFTYATYFKAFYQKMLAVDPAIRIGAVGITGQDNAGNGTHAVPNPNEGGSLHSGWTPVVLATLKSLGVTPHFLIHHSYAQAPGGEDDAFLLQASSALETDAADLRKMIGDYVGGAAGAGIELALTELNSVYSDPGKQSTSLVNGLFMADTVGRLTRTEFNACTWWGLRNGPLTTTNNSASLYGWRIFGDYGVVASSQIDTTAPNTPFPTFYAARLLTKWGRGGDRAISASSAYHLLATHASRLADGSVALLVINKHPTLDLTARISLDGFEPGSASATVVSYGKSNDLANSDLTTGSVVVPGSEFSHSFPSYSMSVVRVKSQFAAWRELNFTAPELDDWSVSGDAGQPARDGVPNLAKYALGLAPKVPATAGLPVPGKIQLAGKTYQTLSFTQRRDLADVRYEVQVSGDLKTWRGGAGQVVRVDDGSTDQAVYRDLTATGDAPQRFIRLQVLPAF